jgi:putative effector of murein hydrolase
MTTPLFWLAVTLVVFEGADQLSRRSERHPLCHPVLLATPVLIGLLLITRTGYATYRSATEALSFLLGPAVVGLAVPVWAQRALIRRLAVPITPAISTMTVAGRRRPRWRWPSPSNWAGFRPWRRSLC